MVISHESVLLLLVCHIFDREVGGSNSTGSIAGLCP